MKHLNANLNTGSSPQGRASNQGTSWFRQSLGRIALIIVVALFFGMKAQGQVPNYVPAGGLLAWYSCNGNATDLTGNGNNGTNFGATSANDRFGNPNSALYFDGLNHTVVMNENVITGSGPFTISAWINYSSTSTTNAIPIWNGIDAIANGFGVGWRGGNGTTLISSWGSGNAAVYSLSPSVNGTWYHVLATYDGGQQQFYINGILQGSNSSISNFANGNTTFGGISQNGGDFFNGFLDDVGFWGRALDSTEIQQLYNAPNPCTQIVNIPDNNFFNYLINTLGFTAVGPNQICASAAAAYSGGINVTGLGISDLTGIEAFTGLTWLRCDNNSLTSLDLSHNTNLLSLECQNNSISSLDLSHNTSLVYLYCYNNSLSSLNVANGNNINFTNFDAANNPALSCIQVDNVSYSNANWIGDIDPTAHFSTNCSPCAPFTPTITVLGDFLCSGNPEQLDAGAGYASYLWNTGDTTETITPTLDETYSVTVTNIGGCTGVASLYFNTTDEAVNIYNSYSPNTICQSTSYQLFVENHFNVPFASYLWSNGDPNYYTDVNTDGLYCVTVTDENGCTGVACINVAVNPTPNITIISTICTGQPAQFDAGAGYADYAWADGETTEVVTPTLTGYYEVTVTDNSGCTASVYEYNDSNFDTLVIRSYYSPTTICEEFQYQLYVYDANDESYQGYLWSDGSNGNSLLVDSSGTYCLTVTDQNSCTATTCVYVSVIPSPTITSNGPVDFCQGGSVTLDAGMFASYLWNDGNTAETDSITVSGDYVVTVTNAAGCSNTAEQTVVADPYPTPEIFSYYSPTFCAGGFDEIFADWFVLYSSYIWSNGSTDANIAVDSTATYYVTVTDAYGCTGTASIDITENPNPAPVVITSNIPDTVCDPTSLILDAGPGYATYDWNNWDNSTNETLMPGYYAGFTYTVEVTDANGCTAMGSYTQYVQNNPLSPIISATSFNICPGGNLSLDAGSWADYSWSDGNNGEFDLISTGGTYAVTVTDVNGCTGVASQFITTLTPPSPVITSNMPDTTCSVNGLILDAGAGYNSYDWYNYDNSTNETLAPTNDYTSTYQVEVTDVNGCTGTGSYTQYINNNVLSPVITANAPTSSCDQNALDSLTLDAGAGYASYLWYSWDNSTNETLTPNYGGSNTYYVEVTDNNGCTGTGSIAVTLYPTPYLTITADGPTTFCIGSSVDLTVTDFYSDGLDTYIWTNGGTDSTNTITTGGYPTVTVTNEFGCSQAQAFYVNVSNPDPQMFSDNPTSFCDGGYDQLTTIDQTTIASYLWSDGTTDAVDIITGPIGTTIYSVTVTDINGCTGVTSMAVTDNPNPVPVITANIPTATCDQNSLNSLILDAGPGYASYDWYSWDNSTNETLMPGYNNSNTYDVQVSDVNGCTATASIVISLYTTPSLSIVPTGNTTICQNTTTDLTIEDFNNDGYDNYNWSTGETTGVITVSTAGTYYVTVSNEFGCSAIDSISIMVSIPNPQMLSYYSTTFCEGNYDLLYPDASNSYSSYLWSDGSNNYYDYVYGPSGTYSVTVTDGYGCTGVTSIDITENLNPTPVITPDNPTFCGQGILDAGAGYASYDWYNTGETTQTISTSAGSGIYYVTVTNSFGCSAYASTSVTVNSFTNPVIFGTSSFCSGDSTVLNVGYYSAYDNYLWSTSDTTSAITAYTTGTYYVTVSDIDGCSAVDSITITVGGLSPVIYYSPATTVCQGTNVYLDAGYYDSYQYSSYLWSTGDAGPVINETDSGTYSVTVTDNSGCTGAASIDITVLPVPSPTITADGPTSFCEGGSVTLDAGAGYADYYWYPNGETTQTISANENTTYYVQVTNGVGCTALASIDISVSPSFNVTIMSSGSDTICYGGSLTLDAGAGYASYDWYSPISSTDEAITAIPTNSYTYYVQVTDSLGCIGNGSVAVTVNDPMDITVTANGPTTFCEGGSVVLDAGAGYATYTWFDGSSTETYSAIYSGNYQVTVTDANGCMGFGSINVTENSNPNPTITSSTGNSTFCFGSSIMLDAGSYTSYLWNTSEITESISDSSSGTFNVTVTDSNGCIGMASIITTELSQLFASIDNQTNTSCNPGNDGSIVVGASGGGGFYEFSDDGGNTYQSSQIFPNLAAGIYNIGVIDQYGCTASTLTTINITTINPVITPLGPITFNAGDSVILDAGSWASYSWSTGATDEYIVAMTGGTYMVTVIDDGGCTGIASIVITVNSISCSISPDGPTTFCDGGSVALDAGSFSSYMWSDGSTDETLTATTGGTYFVTVTDSTSNTCVASIDVTVDALLPPELFISPSASVCSGSNVFIDAAYYSNTGYNSYYWSNGSNNSSIDVDSSGIYSVTVSDNNGCTSVASQVVVVNPNPTPFIGPEFSLPFCDYADLTTGVYSSYIWSTGDFGQTTYVPVSETVTLTVTDVNGCTGTASYDVVVTPSPTPVITGDTSICAGQTTTLDAGGPYDAYSWNTGDTTESITVSNQGYYYLNAYNGGCAGFASVYLTVNAIPTPSITPSGATTFCNGGSVSLDAGSWASYDWSTGESSEAITISTSGTYSVTIMDGNGCMGMTSQSVTVNPNPSPSITPDGSTAFCQGGSVMLDAGTWSAYNWSTGDFSEMITASTSGNYSVTVTDANGCQGMTSQTVTVYANPLAVITPIGATTFCDGGSVTLDAGVWASYNWSTGDATESITTSTAGIYSVTVTDGNGCSGMTSQSVIVNANPAPSVTANGNTTFCNGGSITLDAGLWSSYSWSTGALTETISVTTSGTYSVTITNANGCSGMASSAITVNSNPIPAITPNGPTSFCDGGSVGLDAGTYTSYLWNTGATTESINAFGSQPYCVTVTDANGCSGSNCTFITVYANPIASITGPTTICNGNSATLNAASAASYTWSTGATTQSISTNTSGNYCITVTNANGCTAATCHTLTVFSALVPTITPNGPTSFCQTSNVTLDAGAGYSSYSWSNGATTESVTVNTTANYMVTVTNAAGCTGTASQIVSVTPLITGLTIVGPTTACGGGNVTLTTGTTYNAYNWSNGATTQSINVTTTGIYYVTVSNGGNCTAVAHQSVTILTSPVPNILPSGLSNLCGGGNATLTVGATFASYIWNTSAATQGITINSNGTYAVTVTSTNGCTGTSSLVVTSGCNLPTFPVTPTTNIAATGGMANWIEPSCYYNYTLRVSVHNANAWVYHTLSPNTHFMMSGLTHNTTYDWQIQTNCNASGTANSGYSATQTFTTLARLADGETDGTSTFNVYPNPASDMATITFNSDKEENYNLRLIDMTGRVVMNEDHTAVIGDNQYQMNLSELSKGIYMVVLQTSNGTLQKKIVVQ